MGIFRSVYNNERIANKADEWLDSLVSGHQRELISGEAFPVLCCAPILCCAPSAGGISSESSVTRELG